MAIQTFETGNYEDISNIIIAEMRFTMENNAPCWNTCYGVTLKNGEYKYRDVKVNTITLSDLKDGVDITQSEDINLDIQEFETAEVGGKVILTDKLVRQSAQALWTKVGRLLGDGMIRKREKDVIAKYSGFSNTLGADNKELFVSNAMGCAAYAKANLFPSPVVVVHHPYAIGTLVKDAAGVGTAYYSGIMTGLQEDRLRNMWKYAIDGVNFFESGNIAKISGYDSAYGIIMSQLAIATVTGLAPSQRRQRDESLRGEELIIVADYSVNELDDSYGAKMQYEIGQMLTTATS